MANVSDVDRKVMTALADSDAPMANKQISTATGLDSKEISAAVKGLKKLGFVDSPARCKYGITANGKAALSD